MPPGSTLMRLSRGRWARPNTASDGIWKTLKALSRLGLLFDAVHGFDKFHAAGRDRVLQDHNPYPVAFAPEDIRAIPDVLLNRRQQGTLESVLRNLILLHALLRVTADGHIAEFRDVAIKMVHRAFLLRILRSQRPAASIYRGTRTR